MFHPPDHVYSVGEITSEIRGLLEGRFSGIAVEGEISNFRPSSTGHYYFTLKDRDSALSAVMFRNRLGRLGFVPADGERVIARGSISVYAQRGSYQIICESLEKAGRGELLARLEEIKQRLAQEGLFSADRKRPLPRFPSRIAVVTSPTGAALRDILQVLRRRNAGLSVVILPTAVQGEGAEAQIAAQIKRANRYNLGEVIIVGRGGGSLEDLLPFSTEEVARAVADSAIPVISAVGHEIDTSFCDLAADYRAPTPSAAAEVVSAEREGLLGRVLELGAGLHRELGNRVSRIRSILALFSTDNIERTMRMVLQPLLLRFDDAKEDLLSGMTMKAQRLRHRLELASTTLNTCSPLEVLKRGYAVVVKEGQVVTEAEGLQPGETLTLRFRKGEADAEVTSVRPTQGV